MIFNAIQLNRVGNVPYLTVILEHQALANIYDSLRQVVRKICRGEIRNNATFVDIFPNTLPLLVLQECIFASVAEMGSFVSLSYA